MRGLIVKSPWIDLILQGKKIWEIRGCRTSIRGEIGLIKSGSGLIYGTVEVIDSIELTLEEYQASTYYHCVEDCSLPPYKRIHAWILRNPVLFDTPIKYQHPRGAVIWVKLSAIEGGGNRG